jgi:hypothetical protein
MNVGAAECDEYLSHVRTYKPSQLLRKNLNILQRVRSNQQLTSSHTTLVPHKLNILRYYEYVGSFCRDLLQSQVTELVRIVSLGETSSRHHL